MNERLVFAAFFLALPLLHCGGATDDAVAPEVAQAPLDPTLLTVGGGTADDGTSGDTTAEKGKKGKDAGGGNQEMYLKLELENTLITGY